MYTALKAAVKTCKALNVIQTHDHYGIGAVLYQLSY